MSICPRGRSIEGSAFSSFCSLPRESRPTAGEGGQGIQTSHLPTLEKKMLTTDTDGAPQGEKWLPDATGNSTHLRAVTPMSIGLHIHNVTFLPTWYFGYRAIQNCIPCVACIC